MTTFAAKVKAVVKEIPRGSVMTYQAVAKAAGQEKAARAVASIMAANYDPKIPCHRVILSDGSLGGYNRGGTKKKFELLLSEGVRINKKL